MDYAGILLQKTSYIYRSIHVANGVRRQSGFLTFISCQRQDANVLPKRRQSHQGGKLCDVSTVPLVARWPADLTRTANPIAKIWSTSLFQPGQEITFDTGKARKAVMSVIGIDITVFQMNESTLKIHSLSQLW